MKVVLLGNAGAGKSTLARKLMQTESAARLSLDELAFSGGSDRRPLADSVQDAMAFIASHDSWIVEGCYADIVQPLLQHADTLIFLNPGVEACVRHCQSRPWEPEKFASREQQDSHLSFLLDWVKSYETRTDEYGLPQHRALFDAFAGHKIEYTDAAQYSDTSLSHAVN